MFVSVSAEPFATAVWAVLFAAIPLLVERVHFVDVIPRSRWLSAAGGVSVAYIFLHILPETARNHLRTGSHLPFMTMMAGFIVFYALEQFIRASGGRLKHRQDELLVLHVSCFSLYTALMGFLLVHRVESGLIGVMFFGLAIGLHIFTSGYTLWKQYSRRYSAFAKWPLSGSVLLGWGCGMIFGQMHAATVYLFSFLAGATILNVIKDELPKEQESSMGAFLAGCFLYGLILMLVLE